MRDTLITRTAPRVLSSVPRPARDPLPRHEDIMRRFVEGDESVESIAADLGVFASVIEHHIRYALREVDRG